MLDHLAAQLALRTQLLTLAVCTTGSTSLSATATGYARAAGSFLADGFAAGMEITPSGFTANTVDTITAVTALTLTTKSARAVESVSSGRTIAVALPASRAWENMDFTPVAGVPFVEEDYVPGPVTQITVGPLGQVETTPLYVVKLYGVANTGAGALARYATAVLTLFPPRFNVTLSTGDVLRVRTDTAPYRGQLQQATPGFAVVTVTIPLRGRSSNSI